MWLRRLLAHHLALLVFVSQLYLPVNTHVCHGMGKIWSAIWVKPDSCCKNTKAKIFKIHVHSEQTQRSKLEWKQLPCCESHISCLALAAQYVKSASSSVAKSPETTQAISCPLLKLCSSFLSFQNPLCILLHGPPPPRSGSEILTWHQVRRC